MLPGLVMHTPRLQLDPFRRYKPNLFAYLRNKNEQQKARISVKELLQMIDSHCTNQKSRS